MRENISGFSYLKKHDERKIIIVQTKKGINGKIKKKKKSFRYILVVTFSLLN